MSIAITPRMAKVGQQKLIDLGYEGVEFTDAQVVFRAMIEASPKADEFTRPCPVCGSTYAHEWNCSLNKPMGN